MHAQKAGGVMYSDHLKNKCKERNTFLYCKQDKCLILFDGTE